MQILPRFGRKPLATGHGLHMDDRGLAWVALRRERERGLVLAHCLFETLAPACIVDGQIVELGRVEMALRRLLASAGLPDAGASDAEPAQGDLPALALAMPAGLVSFRQARFPANLSESALAERAHASMAVQLGRSPDELLVDFYAGPPDAPAVAGRGPGTSLALHLAAVSRHAVEDRIAVVEAAGMLCRPVLVTVSAEAVADQEAQGRWSAAAGAAAYELAAKALEASQSSKARRSNRKAGPAPAASFNFLPFRATLRLHQQQVFMRFSACVVLLILLATLVGRWALSAQLAAVQTAHAEVRQSILANDAEAKRRLARASELAVLQGHEAVLIAFGQSRQRLPLLLQELGTLLPQGLHLTGLRLEEQGYVLTGRARSAGDVFELIDRLSRYSLHFTRPTLQGLSLAADGGVAAALSNAAASAPNEAVVFSLRAQPP